MEKHKRRVPLPGKIGLGVLLLALLAAGGFVAKMLYEQSKMTPLTTGEVAPGIYAVRNGFVNFYLIQGDGGYVAIDAGNSRSQTLAALSELGISPAEVRAVLLTHSHGDHVAALDLFPEAKIYLSEIGSDRFTAANNTLKDGETVTLAGLSVECILTPGHTPGSMCFGVDGKSLFVGDTLSLKDGKAGLFNSFYNSDDTAQGESLRKLASTVAPEYIFTAHYGYTDNPAAALADW